jgi:hypothetical protein
MTRRDAAGLDIYDYNALTDAKEEVIEALEGEHEALLSLRYATAIKLVTQGKKAVELDIDTLNGDIEKKEAEIEQAQNELKALQDGRYALAIKVAINALN